MIHSLIICFGRGNLGADSDHVDEIAERRFSELVEDVLHLPSSIACSDTSDSRFVLDQATFLVFRHGR